MFKEIIISEAKSERDLFKVVYREHEEGSKYFAYMTKDKRAIEYGCDLGAVGTKDEVLKHIQKLINNCVKSLEWDSVKGNKDIEEVYKSFIKLYSKLWDDLVVFELPITESI
jgi:hypothetical protein